MNLVRIRAERPAMSTPGWWDEACRSMAAYHRDNPANFPGAAFGVETDATGPLIASVGPGWSDDTICEIGSMTKAVVAAGALLALHEFHDLDPSIEVHTLPGMEDLAHDDRKRTIQVRHLLQNTSGFPNIARYGDWPHVPCSAAYSGNGSAPRGAPDLGPTIPWIGAPAVTNEYIEHDGQCWPARALPLECVSGHVMRHYPMVHEPGAQYSYSTANYIVAARIIEGLSGQSANVYIKNKIFEPLGMADSFFVASPLEDKEAEARIGEGVTQAQRDRVADVALITQDSEMPPEIAPGPSGRWDELRKGWRYIYPDGGMYSTVSDLLAFLRMLRHGGVAGTRQVLPERAVRFMVEDQGFGHTLGFGFRRGASIHGQHAGVLEHLGHQMTYFWLDMHVERPLMGVFLSQRLPNIQVNTNMGDGLRVIFRHFLPVVKQGVSAEA
jgi:CubicO group peptidase (beta-lactamase class C family)